MIGEKNSKKTEIKNLIICYLFVTNNDSETFKEIENFIFENHTMFDLLNDPKKNKNINEIVEKNDLSLLSYYSTLIWIKKTFPENKFDEYIFQNIYAKSYNKYEAELLNIFENPKNLEYFEKKLNKYDYENLKKAFDDIKEKKHIKKLLKNEKQYDKKNATIKVKSIEEPETYDIIIELLKNAENKVILYNILNNKNITNVLKDKATEDGSPQLYSYLSTIDKMNDSINECKKAIKSIFKIKYNDLYIMEQIKPSNNNEFIIQSDDLYKIIKNNENIKNLNQINFFCIDTINQKNFGNSPRKTMIFKILKELKTEKIVNCEKNERAKLGLGIPEKNISYYSLSKEDVIKKITSYDSRKLQEFNDIFYMCNLSDTDVQSCYFLDIESKDIESNLYPYLKKFAAFCIDIEGIKIEGIDYSEIFKLICQSILGEQKKQNKKIFLSHLEIFFIESILNNKEFWKHIDKHHKEIYEEFNKEELSKFIKHFDFGQFSPITPKELKEISNPNNAKNKKTNEQQQNSNY